MLQRQKDDGPTGGSPPRTLLLQLWVKMITLFSRRLQNLATWRHCPCKMKYLTSSQKQWQNNGHNNCRVNNSRHPIPLLNWSPSQYSLESFHTFFFLHSTDWCFTQMLSAWITCDRIQGAQRERRVSPWREKVNPTTIPPPLPSVALQYFIYSERGLLFVHLSTKRFRSRRTVPAQSPKRHIWEPRDAGVRHFVHPVWCWERLHAWQPDHVLHQV